MRAAHSHNTLALPAVTHRPPRNRIALNPVTSDELPAARFTKYLTIYRKIIVRSTYDSD